MGEEANVARIREVYDAFGRGDLPAALGLIHPEIEIDERGALPGGRLYQGRDGVDTWLSDVAERWSTLQLTLHDLRARGDRVLAVVTISAQGAATGAAVQSESSHVWELRDGTPRRMQVFYDRQAAEAATGLPSGG